jgi:hypothetical protein
MKRTADPPPELAPHDVITTEEPLLEQLPAELPEPLPPPDQPPPRPKPPEPFLRRG